MDEFIDNSKREFLFRSAVLGAGAVLGGPPVNAGAMEIDDGT